MDRDKAVNYDLVEDATIEHGTHIDFKDLGVATIGRIVKENQTEVVHALDFDSNDDTSSRLIYQKGSATVQIIQHAKYHQYNEIIFLDPNEIQDQLNARKIGKYHILNIGKGYTPRRDARVLKMSYLGKEYFGVLNLGTGEFAIKDFDKNSHGVHFETHLIPVK